MQAHFLFLHTPSAPGFGSKGQNIFFLMLHIKFKGMEHRAPRKHIFCPYTHPRPLGLGHDQNVKTLFFLKVVMLHIKSKGMEHRAPHKHIFCPHTHPRPLGLDRKVKTFFYESSPVAYQIKGNGA